MKGKVQRDMCPEGKIGKTATPYGSDVDDKTPVQEKACPLRHVFSPKREVKMKRRLNNRQSVGAYQKIRGRKEYLHP